MWCGGQLLLEKARLHRKAWGVVAPTDQAGDCSEGSAEGPVLKYLAISLSPTIIPTHPSLLRSFSTKKKKKKVPYSKTPEF